MKRTIRLSEAKLNNMIQEAIADLSWQEHADMANKHQKKGDEQSSMFSKNGGPSSTWEREQAKKDYDKAAEHRKASVAKWQKETGSKDKKAYEDSLNALKDEGVAEAIVHAVTENVLRVINEGCDPFAAQDCIEQGMIDSFDKGLFNGLGLEAYFDWKKNGGKAPMMTTKQAYKACDAVSDMEEKLWKHNKGDNELSDQLAYIEDELGNLIAYGVLQTNDIAESVIRKINESGNKTNEPYLWLEVCYYPEGTEVAYELDQMIENGEEIPLEQYDYTYGEPHNDYEDYCECLKGYGEIDDANTDTNNPNSYYDLICTREGDYILCRKEYLSDIKQQLEYMGQLPFNAPDNVYNFVKKYCPEYLGEE